MHECIIAGIPVKFPFEPYDLQKSYMAKVIECLENSVNGVLESPTGTGKTLSLLCSSLAWLTNQRDEKQLQLKPPKDPISSESLDDLFAGKSSQKFSTKIIYSSRTHSQIAQAMKELKATGYKDIKAAVIGSRDQLCINTDVMKEISNSNKIHMCKVKITTRSCSFYNKTEQVKDHPKLRENNIMDIEELVTAGRKLKGCPFFLSKHLVDNADIIFMPYNYLLDPMIRKANNISLHNNIVIIDEAHNVENVCEDSASMQFTSSDIALCIDDLTHIMKSMEEGYVYDSGDASKDFTLDDLALLKEMVLKLEKVVDDIEIGAEGVTYPGSYVFDLLEKADIQCNNVSLVRRLIDSIIQFLTAQATQSAVFRRGNGLQKFNDFLTIIFSDISENYKAKISQGYKMYIELEASKTKSAATSMDGWIQPKASNSKKGLAKILNYWCFNPGFSMQHLLSQHVRSVILTSGTLAPLKPYISELGIPVSVRLENPHIITAKQICVKVIPNGSDNEPLICNYTNRDNPKYILSLGRTVLSLCPVIPHGLLIFFNSYSLLNKCKDSWQASGIWSQIQNIKPIFVEPKTKDAFVETINDYYANIQNPAIKGAILMAVCRGKVSEGLDFADINGRAVIITGLPYPPLMDQRVKLKKKYLQENRTAANEMLSGDEWYHLEATRAVNQAIGRIIRHRNDYGAILFFDLRFNQSHQQAQLSSWVREHLKNQPKHINFGGNFGEITRFFRNAHKLPQIVNKPVETILSTDGDSKSSVQSTLALKNPDEINARTRKLENASATLNLDLSIYQMGFEKKPQVQDEGFLSRLNHTVTTVDFNSRADDNQATSSTTKRDRMDCDGSTANTSISQNLTKKRKFVIVANKSTTEIPENLRDILQLVKCSLSPTSYSLFIKALTAYQNDDQIEILLQVFLKIFHEPCLHYIFKGLRRFIKGVHKSIFDEEIKKLN